MADTDNISDRAVLGYAIAAMRRAELSREQIKSVVTELKDLLVSLSPQDAEKLYSDSSY